MEAKKKGKGKGKGKQSKRFKKSQMKFFWNPLIKRIHQNQKTILWQKPKEVEGYKKVFSQVPILITALRYKDFHALLEFTDLFVLFNRYLCVYKLKRTR